MKQLSEWLEKKLSLLDKDHLIRTPRAMSRRENGYVVMDGKSLVNFGSNDYLNYATDARVHDAILQIMQTEYWGTGASPLVTGKTPVHAELEHRLADFTKSEAALVFPSGFAANAGVIAALMESGDTIFSDEKNHASIIDGCRLSKATTNIYSHCDVEALETQLLKASPMGKRMIVTDTLFSMDGDVAPLDEICEIATKYDAIVMVDEAHATGVFGKHGMGISEYQNCGGGVAIHVGTFSKALGSLGGFVSGSRRLIEWLTNQARSYVFSTSPPAAMCAAAITTLGLVQNEPERRIALLHQAGEFRKALTANDWDVGNSCSQIIPITVGQPELTMRWSNALAEHGFLVPGIRPPTVPHGESMLRVSLNYAHDDATIARFVATLNKLRRTMKP